MVVGNQADLMESRNPVRSPDFAPTAKPCHEGVVVDPLAAAKLPLRQSTLIVEAKQSLLLLLPDDPATFPVALSTLRQYFGFN